MPSRLNVHPIIMPIFRLVELLRSLRCFSIAICSYTFPYRSGAEMLQNELKGQSVVKTSIRLFIVLFSFVDVLYEVLF